MAEKNCGSQPRTSARLDSKNYNDITPQQKNNNDDLLENNDNTTDNDKNGSNDEAPWDFERLYSAEEILSNNPPQCDSEHCYNIACSKWTSVFLPNNEWNTCASCLDNEGWPTEEEGLVAQPLSNIHSDAILANCTNDQFQTAESMIEAGLLVEDVDNDEDDDADYRNDEVNEECDDEEEDYDGAENASPQKKGKRRGGKGKGRTSNKKQPSSSKKNGKEKKK